jgi:hypothetical protein
MTREDRGVAIKNSPVSTTNFESAEQHAKDKECLGMGGATQIPNSDHDIVLLIIRLRGIC